MEGIYKILPSNNQTNRCPTVMRSIVENTIEKIRENKEV